MVSLTPVAGAVQLQTSSQGLVQFQTLPLPPPIPFPLFPFLLTHPTAIFEFCTIMCAPCCPQNCTNTPVGCNTTMNIYSVSASCVCVCVCVCVCTCCDMLLFDAHFSCLAGWMSDCPHQLLPEVPRHHSGHRYCIHHIRGNVGGMVPLPIQLKGGMVSLPVQLKGHYNVHA